MGRGGQEKKEDPGQRGGEPASEPSGGPSEGHPGRPSAKLGHILTKGLKVCSFNTRSLRKHMEDVRSDPVLMQSHILCVQETWLKVEEENDERYQLEGFRACFASVGHGKGLAVYVKEGVDYESMTLIPEANIQMMKITMAKLDIITVYRSDSEPEFRAAHFLSQLIDPNKDTLVVGDMNYCAVKEKKDLGKFLAREGFSQLVSLPTHIGGGIHLI